MQENNLLVLSAVVFIGICSQWLAWKVKFPSIIFLLFAGILCGPVTGFIEPDALFGDLLFPLVSLGVAVILFEGGLTLKIREVRNLQKALRNLMTIGMLITWGIVSFAAVYILDFGWELAALFGAIMTVTGPTVIKPLLKTVRPHQDIENILHWEGIILDAVGAVLIVLVYQLIISEQVGKDVPLTFATMVIIGVLCGVVGAFLLAFLLRKHLLPHYLHHVFSLALVLMVFTVSNTVAHESGLLAVTLMGMILANMEDIDMEDILFFKESLSVMFISILFIVLAARLNFEPLIAMGWSAVGMLAVVLFVARPISVLVSSLGTQLSWQARALLCWIAPRGIVAAAVSALFAIRLQEVGVAQAEYLVPLTFLIIIGTVLLQGSTALPLAKLLKVSEPEPTGVLIAGAHKVSRPIAKALQELGFKSRLVDTDWENIRFARMDGLDTYFGRIVSDHADRNMSLSGIGRLLAMSTNSSLNALASTRFKSEFDPGNVFYLQSSKEERSALEKSRHLSYSGRQLFGDDVTFAKLASMISQGAKVRITFLGEHFSYQDYLDKYQNKAIPLFAVDGSNQLHFFTTDIKLTPGIGWKIGSLIPSELLNTGESEALA